MSEPESGFPQEAPLTFREKLDECVAKGCSNPDCNCQDTVMFINQRCHPEVPTEAFYNRENGTLTIACSFCHEPVITVAVA